MELVKEFRAQRNFYISGTSLFLWLYVKIYKLLLINSPVMISKRFEALGVWIWKIDNSRIFKLHYKLVFRNESKIYLLMNKNVIVTLIYGFSRGVSWENQFIQAMKLYSLLVFFILFYFLLGVFKYFSYSTFKSYCWYRILCDWGEHYFKSYFFLIIFEFLKANFLLI